jgi:hypothetical protein
MIGTETLFDRLLRRLMARKAALRRDSRRHGNAT